GCFSASSTLPTRKRPRFPSVSGTPRRTTRSTSQLVNTSRRASSSTGRSNWTYSRSQLTGTFISDHLAHRSCACQMWARGSPSKLLQDADVVVPEQPQIREPVPEHGDALDPEAEREAGPDLGVVADVDEHLRVDPAGTAHLDPAGVLADRAALAVADEAGDVELDGRLGEREEARPHADFTGRAEQLAEEVAHRALEVGERDPAVDDERLDLEERRGMRRVGRVPAVDAAGHDRPDRRLARLHQPDLVGRRMRAEKH